MRLAQGVALLGCAVVGGGALAGVKRTTQTDWHPEFAVPVERRVLDATNSLVDKRTWTYNARGQALTVTQVDPVTGATRTTTTTYCEQADLDLGTCPRLGLVTAVDGPRTDVVDVTTYTYYPSEDPVCATSPTTCSYRKGDLWLVQDATGSLTETLKYDGAGRVLSVKDANGAITDFTYHPRGWLAARKERGPDPTSEADDRVTRIDYYATGLVQRVTLPDGSLTEYTYDAAHRLTDIADGEGNRIHYTLDNAGNRTKEDTIGVEGTVLRTLSRVFNQLGQLQTHKDAYQQPTVFTYDANGNNKTVTDALGRVTENQYDALNRLSQTIQDVGGINATTQFRYDARDNLTAVIDPKGLTTSYTYNGLGDLTQLISPDTGTTAYSYDSAGNRIAQSDARQVTTAYRYDVLNRLTSITYPDSSINVGYAYDIAAPACGPGETFAAARLSRMTDSTGDTQYCYDRFGQVVRKVQTTQGLGLTVRYSYTPAGQLSRVVYPDGSEVDYVRDALGHVIEVGVTRPGGPREVLLTGATYYPFGPVAQWTYGNGRTLLRTLNQNYQPGVVQDLTAGGVSLGYEFDAVGNLAKLRNGNQAEPPLRRYNYDALNRLTEARDGTTEAFLEGYRYDGTGNRIEATIGTATQSYIYGATDHRLQQVGATARSHDAVGNTTAIGGADRTFVYNDANRLQQVSRDGVIAASYLYNGRGEQVQRSHGMGAIVTVFDEAGRWLGEYEQDGTPKQQIVWLDDLPVGLLVGPVAANVALHYIQADALGTPRTIIEPQRNVPVWKWPLAGEAFGSEAPLDDPDGDGAALTFDMRFPGQRYDGASGLNYNYFRDYEPGAGRYAQSDPIGLVGGLTTFSYAGSDPLASFDRYGLYIQMVGQALCDAITGIAGNWHGRKNRHFLEHSSEMRKSVERNCDRLYFSCKSDLDPACIPRALAACRRMHDANECYLEEVRGELGLIDPLPWWDILGPLCNLGGVSTKIPRDPLP